MFVPAKTCSVSYDCFHILRTVSITLKCDEGQSPGDMSGVDEDYKHLDSKYVCQSFVKCYYCPSQKVKEMYRVIFRFRNLST